MNIFYGTVLGLLLLAQGVGGRLLAQGMGGSGGFGGSGGTGGGASSATLPVFSQQALNYFGSTGCPGSSTTCTVTLTPAVGDVVAVNCGTTAEDGGLSSYTVTSVPSESFTAGVFTSNGGVGSQLNVAKIANAGSHVFTCTTNNTQSYPWAGVFDYTGGAGTINAHGESSTTSGTSPATNAFTTTGGTVTVACMTIFPGTTITAGLIGGSAATHLIGNTYFACEDYSTASIIAGGTASFSLSPSTSNAAVVSMSIQ